MAAAPLGRQISGALFATVLLVVAALLFYLVWFLVSPSGAFYALLDIGFLALAFGLVAYLLRSAVASPALARAVSWGFAAMGFVVAGVTLLFYPVQPEGTPTRILLSILLLLALAIALLGYCWSSGARASDARREAARAEWRARPVTSAFDYTTAQTPSAPPPAAMPPAPGPPPPGGR